MAGLGFFPTGFQDEVMMRQEAGRDCSSHLLCALPRDCAQKPDQKLPKDEAKINLPRLLRNRNSQRPCGESNLQKVWENCREKLGESRIPASSRLLGPKKPQASEALRGNHSCPAVHGLQDRYSTHPGFGWCRWAGCGD